MTYSTAFRIVFRYLLPPFLVCGVIFRINGISLGYLLCLLAAGLCNSGDTPGIGQLGVSLTVILLSAVSLLGQGLFQITRTTSYVEDKLAPCNSTEKGWRQIGFNQMSDFSGAEMVRFVLPDIGIFLLSLVLLLLGVGARRRQRRVTNSILATEKGNDGDETDGADAPRQRTTVVFNVIYCLLLLVAGCAFPSIISFSYIALFIGIVFFWAANYGGDGSEKLVVVKYMMVIYSGLHVTLLYLYLFQFFQDGVDYESLVARILGLNAITQTNCDRPWELKLRQGVKWSEYLSPILVLVLYWFSARAFVFESQKLRTRAAGRVDAASGRMQASSQGSPTELTRLDLSRTSTRSNAKLLSGRRSQSRASSTASEGAEGTTAAVDGTASWRPRSMAFQPANSVVGPDGAVSVATHAQNQDGDTTDGGIGSDAAGVTTADRQQQQPSVDASSGPIALINHPLAYTYIATLIAMMVWSIAYLSWLTFALLLLTFVIWVLPDSGNMCARVSPFLAFYATCLVLIEYLYGLNLTDEELRQHDDVGLTRHTYPFGHLLLKVLFLCIILLPMYYRFSNEYAKAVEREHSAKRKAKERAAQKADAARQASAEAIPMQRFPDSGQGTDGASTATPQQGLASDDAAETGAEEGDGQRPSSEQGKSAIARALTPRRVLAFSVAVLSRYWILVCLLLYLFASLIPSVSIFKIVYMCFFLLFLLTSQLTGSWSTYILHGFWHLAVVYSMAVVAMLYTFQFDVAAASWNESLSEDWIKDLGLESYRNSVSYDRNELFVQLLLPVAVLFFVVMHIRFFYSQPVSPEYEEYKAEKRQFQRLQKQEAKQRKLERGASGSKRSALGSQRGARASGSTAAGRTAPVALARAASASRTEADARSTPKQSASATAAAKSQAVLAGSAMASSAAAKAKAAKQPVSRRVLSWTRNILYLVLLRLLYLVSWGLTMLIRCLDVHMGKLVLLIVVVVSLTEVCGANIIAMIVVCVTAMFPGVELLSYFVFDLWAVVSIVAKMGFQLQSVRNYEANEFSFSNCSGNITDGRYQDDAAWIGLLHTSYFPGYIEGYLWILALIVLRVWIHRYQKTVRKHLKEKKDEAIAQYLASKEYEARHGDDERGDSLTGEPSGQGQPSHILPKEEERAVLSSQGIIPAPDEGSVFADVERADADKDLLTAAAYLINNFFELFGEELVVIVCGIVVAVRVDGAAIVYGLMLGFLISPLRRYLTGFFALCTSVMMLLQYLLLLGGPPSVCYLREGYPWSASRSPLDDTFAHFFYLTSALYPQDKWLLVGDLFLLLCLSIQWRQYRASRRAVRGSRLTSSKYTNVDVDAESHGMHGAASAGGSKEMTDSRPTKAPAVPDFTSASKRTPFSPPELSWLDYAKNLIFQHFFWITLVIVFFAGTARNSLFCLGYLIFAFVFLWYGTDQLHNPKPRKSRKAKKSNTSPRVSGHVHVDGIDEDNDDSDEDDKGTDQTPGRPRFVWRWKVLLWYTYFVILIKIFLQIWACVDFGETFKCEEFSSSAACTAASLLSVVCLKPLKSSQTAGIDPVGLTLDVVSLGFLLLQLRIFSSPYFTHVQNHLDLFSKFADNGVDLMRKLLMQRRDAQKKYEGDLLADIKTRVKYLEDHPTSFQILYEGTYVPLPCESGARGESAASVSPNAKKPPLVSPTLAFSRVAGTEEADGGAEEADDNAMLAAFSISGLGPDGRDAMDGAEKAEAPMDEDAFDEFIQEKSNLRKIKKAVNEFFETTIIRWLDEVSFDYLYVETRLRRLMYKEKVRKLQELGDASDFPTVDLQPRGTSMRVFGDTAPATEGNTNDDHVDGAAADGVQSTSSPEKKNFFNQLSVVSKVSKAVESLVPSTAEDIPMPESDPIVRLLRFGRPVEAEDEAADATEKLLRSELADVVYVPVRFGWALYYAILARTDVFCYFVMILDHIISGSVLTMPLPFFVFLWGAMSKPRPSTRFWSFVILYVQVVIIVKYIFQSQLVYRNVDQSNSDNPLWAPRIFGVDHTTNFSRSVAADLVVLLSLCFHRAILRFHGFWGDSDDSEAESTSSGTGTPTATDEGQAADQEDAHSSTGNSGDTASRPVAWNATATAATARPAPGSSASPAPVQDADQSPKASLSASNASSTKDEEEETWWGQLFHHIERFYKTALDSEQGGGRKDYYTVMFLFDLLTFLITIFGWSSFAEKSASAAADVTTYISQNYVPRTFLAMVLVEFLLLIVDRVLYLRKYIYVKFLFQIFLLVVVHVYLFFILPFITERSFVANPVAQLWYFCKCVYFAVSAMQLAAGYPTQILGQFLTKGANIISAVLFLVVQAIPFLLEFRELLDWACTPTVLSIIYWFKVQDIWSSIFVIKSFRTYEKSAPRKLGTTVSLVVKILVGGLGVVGLILVLWFPLVLMSLINSTSRSNPPMSVRVQLQIGGYQPLFHFTADQQFLRQISDSEMDVLKNQFTTPQGQSFITKYVASDVTKVSIPGESSALWSISPPTRRLMQTKLLANDSNIDIAFEWTVTRETQTGLAAESVSNINSSALDNGTRNALFEILSSGRTNATIHRLYPRFVLAPANGQARAVTELNDNSFVDVNLLQQREGEAEWWSLSQLSNYTLPFEDKSTLEMFIVSDRVAAPQFSFLAGYGVIGLYVSLVLVVGQFLRLMFKNISHRIIYENIPNPDALHTLCHNIFMARESEKFYLEERLAGQLFLLYRSPERLVEETLVKEQKTYRPRARAESDEQEEDSIPASPSHQPHKRRPKSVEDAVQ